MDLAPKCACAVQLDAAKKGVNMTFNYVSASISFFPFPENQVSCYRRLCFQGLCHNDTAILPALLSYTKI